MHRAASPCPRAHGCSLGAFSLTSSVRPFSWLPSARAGDMDCSGGGRYSGAAAAGDAGLMSAHQNRGVLRSQHALPPGLGGGGVGPGRAADGSGRILTSHATALCQVSQAVRNVAACVPRSQPPHRRCTALFYRRWASAACYIRRWALRTRAAASL